MTHTTSTPTTRKHVTAGTFAMVKAVKANETPANHDKALALTSKYYGSDSHMVVGRITFDITDRLS